MCAQGLFGIWSSAFQSHTKEIVLKLLRSGLPNCLGKVKSDISSEGEKFDETFSKFVCHESLSPYSFGS